MLFFLSYFVETKFGFVCLTNHFILFIIYASHSIPNLCFFIEEFGLKFVNIGVESIWSCNITLIRVNIFHFQLYQEMPFSNSPESSTSLHGLLEISHRKSSISVVSNCLDISVSIQMMKL